MEAIEAAYAAASTDDERAQVLTRYGVTLDPALNDGEYLT